MRLVAGVKQWWSDLRRIYATDKIDGIEKGFDLSIFALLAITPTQIIQFFCGGREQAPKRLVGGYVLIITLVLACLLYWSDSLPRVSVGLAGWFLASTIIVLFNVLFLSKLPFIGPPRSPHRTLILFMVNVIQLVLAFAIFYRFALPKLSNMDAVFNALLVFGTIGYPKGANLVVGSQIFLDFVLLAVFLAFVVGKLGNWQDGAKS
jgi:hypothetical protein